MEIEKVVLDANVITKWFIEEKDSDKANILREKYINGKIEIVVSPIFYFEILNALKYSNLLNQSELNTAGESLENYGFTEVSIQNEIRELMIQIAVLHDMTIYDASYVALSVGLECFFYTADEKIAKKLPKKFKKNIKSLDNL